MTDDNLITFPIKAGNLDNNLAVAGAVIKIYQYYLLPGSQMNPSFDQRNR